MHRQQSLLHQVLDLIGPLGQAAPQKRPQVGTQFFQKTLVRTGVGFHPLQQQRTQPVFNLHGVSQKGIRALEPSGYSRLQKKLPIFLHSV